MLTSNVFQSMTTAIIMLMTVHALPAIQDTNLKEESVSQPILFARPAIVMEPALLAILKIFFTKETACLLTSLPTSCSTTLSAALRSSPNCRLLNLANEMILLDYDNILTSLYQPQ